MPDNKPGPAEFEGLLKGLRERIELQHRTAPAKAFANNRTKAALQIAMGLTGAKDKAELLRQATKYDELTAEIQKWDRFAEVAAGGLLKLAAQYPGESIGPLQKFKENPRCRDAIREAERFARRLTLRQVAEAGQGVHSSPTTGNTNADGIAFPPMEFVHSTGRYHFGRRTLLWQLWKAIWQSHFSLNLKDLEGSVPTWRDGTGLTQTNAKRAVTDLRNFWRRNGRPDLAKAIKMGGGAFLIDREKIKSH